MSVWCLHTGTRPDAAVRPASGRNPARALPGRCRGAVPGLRAGAVLRGGALALAIALASGGAVAADPAPAAEGAESQALAAAQQEVFRAALAAVEPAIVRIDTIGGAMPVQPTGGAGDEQRAAPVFRAADGPTTGLIYSAEGYIITSSFNFIRDPSIITVTLHDGRRLVARLVARDRSAGLALLKVPAGDLTAPTWAPGSSLRPGQWTLAAGFGHGGSRPALSVGILSALHRARGLAVQTDARISPVNYGGPLFDVEGRVIGVCVPLSPGEDPRAELPAGELAGVEWYDSGIGFAVLADVIHGRVARLRNGVDLHRGRLGVAVEPTHPFVGAAADDLPHGLRIVGEPRGPAAAAGLRPGDILTHVDDAPVAQLVDLRRALARRVAGEAVAVQVLREGQRLTVQVQLAAAQAFEPPVTAASQPAAATTRPDAGRGAR